MSHTHPTTESDTPTLTGRIYTAITALSMTVGRGPAARKITTQLGVGPSDRVVDIGCGPGAAVREAARRGAVATGVDPDPTMLGLARLISKARRAHNVTWVQGSAESVPLPDASATAVVAISSSHHWEDLNAGLSEATRLLAPGGRVLIAERLTQPGARGHAAHGLTTEQAEQLAADLAAADLVEVNSRCDRVGHKTLLLISGSKRTPTLIS